MGFFKGFNFVRAITLLSLIGAMVLGYLAWKQREGLESLRLAMLEGGKIEKLVSQIQRDSIEYSALVEERDSDKWLGQADPEEYIRKMAGKDDVEIGQVEITIGSGSGARQRGVKDDTYKIQPYNKERSLYRMKIANFLYSLEVESRRVRVTDVKIDLADKRVEPHEYPEDRWTFECTITSRQKSDS